MDNQVPQIIYHQQPQQHQIQSDTQTHFVIQDEELHSDSFPQATQQVFEI